MKNKTSKILVGMVFVLAIIAVSLMLIETNEPQEEKQYAKYISLLRTHDEFGIPIKQSPFGYFEKIDPEKLIIIWLMEKHSVLQENNWRI